MQRKKRTRTGVPLLDRMHRAYEFARELESEILVRAPELATLPPVAAYLAGDITPPVVNALRGLVADEEPPERLLLLVLHMTATSIVGIAVLHNEHVANPEQWHTQWAHEIERSLANANAVLEIGDATFGDSGWIVQKLHDPSFRHDVMHPAEPTASKDMN